MKIYNIDFLIERKPENPFCYLKHCIGYAYDNQLGTEFLGKSIRKTISLTGWKAVSISRGCSISFMTGSTWGTTNHTHANITLTYKGFFFKHDSNTVLQDTA